MAKILSIIMLKIYITYNVKPQASALNSLRVNYKPRIGYVGYMT